MTLYTIITYLLLGAFISILISFPIIYSLYKLKLVRSIDADYSAIIAARRLKLGTPIMGGLIIVITVLIINLIFNFNGTTKIPILVFAISALLGAVDDVLNIYGKERKVRSVSRTLILIKIHKNYFMRIIYLFTLPWTAYKWFFFLLGSNPGKGLQAHEKIIIQTIIGCIVAWWLYCKSGWENPGQIWVPFIDHINLGIFIVPLIIFTIIFMTNAVNITDGMDGLSSGLLNIAFSAFAIIGFFDGNEPITILLATAIGSIFVYLYFNIPPARFQMGDVGSLALGTLLATVAFALDRAFLLPIIGFVFVLELFSALIQGIFRRLIGRRLFRMAPLHHHFEMIGWPEYKVVMRAWVLAPLFAAFAIWLAQF